MKFGIEKKEERYQLSEGLLDLIKVFLTGNVGDIKKMDNKKLSKRGLEMKKNIIAIEKEFAADAKAKGMTTDQYLAQMRAKYA